MALSRKRLLDSPALIGREDCATSCGLLGFPSAKGATYGRSASRTVHLSTLETLRAAVALAVVALALALCAAASAAATVKLPAGWSHAQVNVVIKHVGYTMIYDRGLVAQVAPGSLTLKEGDGSVVLIRVAMDAAVTLGGRAIALAGLHRGEFAQTVRVDGAPAEQVRAQRVAPAG
jgi:hypothetical protein